MEGDIFVSKKILFSLSKAMTIILATVFTMLLLVSCPTPEDIPAVGTKYDDEKNNLRYIVNDGRTLAVKKTIDSTLEDWVCIIPKEYEGIKVTSIGDGAFTYCSRLTEIHINKPKDTISGSPWGAPDTTIIKWKGEF